VRLRTSAAIVAARTAAGLSRTLRVGGGTALPGLVAERLDPDIVPALASALGQGSVLITGTNGKTTSSRLVRNIVEAAGLVTVANREGSNMMRGVAAALAESATWDGRVRRRKKRIGVFEVDEATVPKVAAAVRPRAVTFTNLFRDQLDRYGEVETVAAIWREAVGVFLDDVTLVLNADDPSVAALRDHARCPVVLFGLDDASLATATIEHAADARWCTKCGAELAYEVVFYGHIGHWRCPSCGNARPTPDVIATNVTAADGLAVTIQTPTGEMAIALPLEGTYNVYNALAAAATGVALAIDDAAIERGLEATTAAFGRQERFAIDGRDVHMILAKNPAGLNQVLRTLPDGEVNLVLFLNDDIELLAGRVRTVIASGRRANDMAVRLKYSGIAEKPVVVNEITSALREAISATPEGASLYAIPTYTAMLEARNVLGKWAGRGRFWEGDSK
jgi:lipid II isoglutaminyl synthase (glutamine-hydrolysing)